MARRRLTRLHLGLVVALSLVGSAAAPALASAPTTVTVFRAFTAAGSARLPVSRASGYCWTGSIAADRRDAWRCFVGNEILDPCFSSHASPRVVLCPDAQLTRDIEIHLTRSLPLADANHATASVRATPWLIESAGRPSARCERVTGATNVVAGVPLSYFCSSSSTFGGLWGSPLRAAPTWTMVQAPERATSLRHAKRVALRHVWT